MDSYRLWSMVYGLKSKDAKIIGTAFSLKKSALSFPRSDDPVFLVFVFHVYQDLMQRFGCQTM